jgi:hypothetical protein
MMALAMLPPPMNAICCEGVFMLGCLLGVCLENAMRELSLFVPRTLR